MARLRADPVKLHVQLDDFRLGRLRAFTHAAQLVAGGQGVAGHGTCGADHLLEHRRQFFQAASLLDQPGVFFHLAAERAGGVGDQGQALDESAQHQAHFLLRFDGPSLGLCLLLHHVAPPALHIVEPAQGQRRRGRANQGLHLPLEPVVVYAQLANIFHDQPQQVQQHGLDLRLVLGGKRHPVPEGAQHLLDLHEIRTGLPHHPQQFLGLLGKPGVVRAQRWPGKLDQSGNLLQKVGRQGRRGDTAGRHHQERRNLIRAQGAKN